MMQTTACGSFVLGLLGLLLWAGNAHAVACENNIPASNPDSMYTDHGNGTVTDTRTGLMWKQCAEGLSGATCEGPAQTLTWADALAHAEASAFANYTDWRLPNVKELSSLVEDCRALPSINTNRFPNTRSSYVWSGSPFARYSGQAWVVVFDHGLALNYGRSLRAGVRLVRGGQSGDVALPPDDVAPLPEIDPAVSYLAFLEGNPGIEGDGIFVAASQISPVFDFFLTVQPKPLVGVLEEGVTLTVISRLPRERAYAQIFYHFGYAGIDCLIRLNDNLAVFHSNANVEAAYYQQDFLARVTDEVKAGIGFSTGARFINQTSCSQARLSDMFFNGFEFQLGVSPLEVDAAILDRGLVIR